ncbi:hypothetical protein ACEQ8H_006775 [Pleosporales sp. CAS-2024a]
MAEEASRQLLEDVKRYLKASDFSDFDITCHDHIFRVHKLVLCTRSQFFANALKFPGKHHVPKSDPADQEHEEGRIDLPDDEPAMIKLMIDYIYSAEYEPFLPRDISKIAAGDVRPKHSCKSGHMACPNYGSSRIVCLHHTCGVSCAFTCTDFVCDTCHPPPVIIPGSSGQLLTHAKMYEMGDKYQVSGLKELSQFKFELACAKFWHDKVFAQAAAHAFSTTPEDDKGLRRIVIKTISEHMGLLKKKEVSALLMEFNGLAFGLLVEKAEKNGWLD